MKNNWQTKKLGEVCKIGDGNHSSKYPKKNEMITSGIPFIRANNLINGKISWVDMKYISPVKHEDLKKGHLKTGDILFTNRGEIGKLAVVSSDFNNSNLNSQIAWFRPNPDLLNIFLYYFLKSPLMQDSFLQQKNGAALQQLTIGQINKIEISFPSLPEQKRIVKKLDAIFENIDKAKENTEKNLQNSKKLFESYLRNIFNNPGNDWQKSALGEVCKFQGGSQPSKDKFIYHPEKGYIRLLQIRDYKSDKNIVYIPIDQAKRFCKSDDVMIGRYGPPLFQILKGLEGAYNVALIKAIPDEKILEKDYLYYFLKNPDIFNYIIRLSSRTAGQTGLNKETLEVYPISYPNIKIQKEIVNKIKLLSKQTKKLEDNYREKLQLLGELKKSVLAKAFAGELQ